MKSWDAIGELLNRGRSWSGYERNCCYLNTRDGRFADVSAVTGLDLVADSRAAAPVDWDRDGDLDLWISNRTAPRIQLLRNDWNGDSHFLAVRLVGTRSNRDAIGARLELFPHGEGERPLVRFVKAGDGYLAQSSKWVHFGLGSHDRLDRLVVLWPGGAREEILDLQADRRYQIVQGTGQAELWAVRRDEAEPANAVRGQETRAQRQETRGQRVRGQETRAQREQRDAIRIVPHRRLPLPEIPCSTWDGESVVLPDQAAKWTLIVVWASWCQPCLEELSELSRFQPRLTAHGCQVIALNVDELTEPPGPRLAAARRVFESLRVPFLARVASAAGLERLDAVQRVLVSLQQPLPVPASFLIDEAGRLAALYKGRLHPELLLTDITQLKAAPDDQIPYEAVPFPGRWYVNPLPADLLAIPEELLQISHAAAALDYLRKHVWPMADAARNGSTVPFYVQNGQLADLTYRVGLNLARQPADQEAAEALQFTVRLAPDHWQAYLALGGVYGHQGHDAEAVTAYRKVMQMRPDDPLAANNVAWILATTRSDTLRDAAQAIRIAEQVCRVTNYQLPAALDTLAAAYAADGRFEEAVATADRAVERARQLQQLDTAERIEARGKLYRNSQPYRE